MSDCKRFWRSGLLVVSCIVANEVEEELQEVEASAKDLREQEQEIQTKQEEYRGLRSQQRNETKRIRDWHIMRWWRWGWKDEMEVYGDQVQEDETQLKKDEEDLDRALTVTNGKLEALEVERKRLQKKKEDLITSDGSWETTLNAVGLFAAEDEVKKKDQEIQHLKQQFLQAFKATGVVDPELQVEIITEHERSKVLLFEANTRSSVATERMRSLASEARNLETLASSNSGPDLVKAVFWLAESHQEQKRLLEKSKAQVRANFVNSAAYLNLLGPVDDNRTA